MPDGPPRVVVIDDGELLLVRELLNQLGVEHEDRTEEAAGGKGAATLLITNARLALSHARPRARLHLVVYDDVSKTLRRALERSGCDLALQAPLDAGVLRMIVDRAVYSGPERRTRRRAMIASEIKVRYGIRQLDATLGELSARGCSLLLDGAVPVGKKLRLATPADLSAQPMKLEGAVVSCTPVASESGRFHVSLRFDGLSRADQQTLHRLVLRNALPDRRAAGSLRGARAGRSAPRSAAPSEPPSARDACCAEVDDEQAAVGADRRKHPRKLFKSQLLATGGDGPHLLFGCDLSTGGMRVRHEPDLAIGDRLKLALYARKGLPSVMLRAVVVHEGRDGTFGLSFEGVPEKVLQDLERIVDALPALPTSKKSPAVIVSEVLEHEAEDPQEGADAD